jgi:hypothetical protein
VQVRTWTVSLPRLQCRRAFCERPRRSTSPPPNRRLPRPPSAAPAAGGWGNPDSRRVHSVGCLRCPAGGVGEEVARPVLLLQVVVFLFVGGAPRSSAVDLPSLPCPQLYGAAVGAFPLPASVGRRSRFPKISWKRMLRFGASTTAASGVGPLWPVLGDFPSARGLLLIQGVKGSRCGGAPPTAPCRRRGRGAGGSCCNFLIFCVPFCNFAG